MIIRLGYIKHNMKNIIILPGNSEKNKEWLDSAREFFGHHFDNVYTLEYEHWSKGGEMADINTESTRLGEIISKLDGSAVILAKSVGSLLTIYSYHSNKIDRVKIQKCVFLGFPLKWGRSVGFDIDTWSLDFSFPTQIIQNTDDPVTSAPFIRSEQDSGKFVNLKLIEHEGDDHWYGYFDDILKYII